MDKIKLEQQSDKIEAILTANGIEARVTGGIVTPRAVIFQVSKSLPKGNGLAVSLALALNVPSVAIDHNTITVKRQDASVVSLLALLGRLAKTKCTPSFTATLGMCDDGAPLLIRLPSEMVGHVLVTGAGASDLLRTIAISLIVSNRPRAMRLVLAGRKFGDLARLPHAQYYSIDDIMPLVGRSVIAPRVVIVLDDLATIDENMMRILQDGHKSGIHVIASGNVSSSGFSTILKSNGELGDFTALADGQAVRFTAAYISPAEVNQIVMGTLPKMNPSRLQVATA